MKKTQIKSPMITAIWTTADGTSRVQILGRIPGADHYLVIDLDRGGEWEAHHSQLAVLS